MKINVFAPCLFVLLFSGCTGKKEAPEKEVPESSVVKKGGIDPANMDPSFRPQDDFYNYVNGGWMKTAVIPSDRSSWGSFNELRERTDEQCLSILNKILKEDFPKDSEGSKIQALYAVYMDVDKRDEQGIGPLKSQLEKIEHIDNMNKLQQYLVEVTEQGDNPFYSWRVYADMKNSQMNTIYLDGVKLGLGRDYFQKENEANTKVLSEYKRYVKSLLEVLQCKNAESLSTKIVDFEKRMAQTLLPNEKIRNQDLKYNPFATKSLSSVVKNVNLPEYLKQVGVNSDQVIIPELNYYKNLDSFLNAKNLPLIKDFLKYNLLTKNASVLDQKLNEIQFNFYGKYLQGQKEQRSMEKRALSFINTSVGEAFGKLYVGEYFSQEAKEKMLVFIDYLKRSFQKHIQDLDWMSEATKGKALEKLGKFSVKIAYPDKWRDYSGLRLISQEEGGSLYANQKNLAKWEYQESLEKVGKSVDKSRWSMSPQTVNAYYNPSNNEIVFPAAILQAPFFSLEVDPAINFGGIGAVIGHEITHGFDDSGSKFDGDGNLINWWTENDRKNFESITKRLAEQYDKYEPVKGSFVNGKFTLGENIADLGGVSIAFDALKMYLSDYPSEKQEVEGFTQEQRFFISWATVWRNKSTDEYFINQVKTDPHAPAYLRAFAPLVNVNPFYEAFAIKEGDKLYRDEGERIKIW